MLNLRRQVRDEPTAILAVLWPLTLLAPLLPWIPRSSTGGLPWKQEVVLASLLLVTTALLLRRAYRTRSIAATIRRHELFIVVPIALFVLWSGASFLWATSAIPAVHHTFLWSAYLLFFIFLGRAARSRRLLRSSLITFGVVLCIISIACIVEFWGSSALLIRTSTGLGEPLAVAVPLFTVLALRLRQRRAAIFCGVTSVLSWLAVLQSLERAPLLGASAALLIIAGTSLFARRWRPQSLSRAVILILFLGAATALQIIPSPATGNKPSTLSRLQSTSEEDPNTRVRFLCWAVGLEMWRENPLTGVGANNYDIAFPDARANFSAKNPDSSLVKLNEDYLVERAHNEYVQILAELGVVGLTLFLLLAVGLIFAAWRALRSAQSSLALGSTCSLIAFALSSGASSVSFRWAGSGLVFFFAASLVLRFSRSRPMPERTYAFSPAFVRMGLAATLLLSFVVLCGRGAQGTSSVLLGMAESASSIESREHLYESSISWNPYDATAHFNFGVWLYLQRRPSDAVYHLRFAVERGLNSSVCYAYLAAAEAGAGDLQAAERTLGKAVRVYPKSVFLRVRHATALTEAGQIEAAENEYRVAMAMKPREARGWRQLISFGRKAAKTAAFYDKSIAMPGELVPENCIFAVLDENERRQPARVLEELSELRVAIR